MSSVSCGVLTLQSCVCAVPANDQTVDSILVFNLVLSWGAQWVDWHSSFIPANSHQLMEFKEFCNSCCKRTFFCCLNIQNKNDVRSYSSYKLFPSHDLDAVTIIY